MEAVSEVLGDGGAECEFSVSDLSEQKEHEADLSRSSRRQFGCK